MGKLDLAHIALSAGLFVASAGFLVRWVLLSHNSRGWPIAPAWVRVPTCLMFLALLERALEVLWRDPPLVATQLITTAVLALYSVLLAVNVAIQRRSRDLGRWTGARAHLDFSGRDPSEPPQLSFD